MINLAPLIKVWSAGIKAAGKSRRSWESTAEVCSQFYSGSMGFMWEKDFRRKHMGGLPSPQFQITIAKSFELVSVVGPTLLWREPGRLVSGYEKMDIPPEVHALLQGINPQDPQFQQVAQQVAMQEQQERAEQEARNSLMQAYLNYSHREQPGGGLKFDSHIAIIDALVKGRGCIRVDRYMPPGNTGELTGGFYMNVDDLFIDPDCTRPNLSNAKWIAIRHVEPHWEVERRFGWPDGSLKGKSANESKQSAAANTYDGMFARKSDTNDLCVWYEIFSRCGVGTRFKQNVMPQWHQAFEDSVGDNAYLCIMKNVDEPLNLRSEWLENAEMEQVGPALSWPIPFDGDNRWPVAMLDFWHNPGSAWPLAPLAMGLGELMFMNIFISSLADRVYRSGLSKIAIRSELAEDCVSKLMSLSHEVVELNPTIATNINEMISYLEYPQVNFDVFRMLEYVSSMFDKRVGLMELLYGLNPGGKVSRTASDAKIKGEAVSVRPEHMAEQVASWQTEIANLERIAAGDGVKGETLMPLLGTSGAGLWDKLITQADPAVYMRQMRSRIEADSIRKPNRAKANENLTQMAAYTMPLLQWYAAQTGNTEPLNAFLQTLGKAVDQEVEDWLMPPINQQQEQGPSPEEQQMMQEQQEMARRQQEMDMAEKASKIEGQKVKNAQSEMQTQKLAHEMLEMGVGIPEEEIVADDLVPDVM